MLYNFLTQEEGKNASDKTLADLTKEEFEELLQNMMEEHFHDLSPSEFFTALAAIDEEQPKEVIELTVSLKDGQLIFKEPAPLFVTYLWETNRSL